VLPSDWSHVSGDDARLPLSAGIVACPQCDEPYRQTVRSDGSWFHYMVVTMHPQPDGQIRVTGHWRAGDSACEARGQRTLILPGLNPLQPYGCIRAAR
jgi:hypothetical protein